jgi:transposase
VPLREDFRAGDLRRLDRASRDAGQSRRLLALAAIYDGASRTQTARIRAVALQTVRDCVLAFNVAGPAGLIDCKAPGQKPKLDATQRKALP